MQCFSCKKKKINVQNYMLHSQETKATLSNRESHPVSPVPFPFQVRAGLLQDRYFQFCACMCKLCLHMKINEPDNITASPEVLHDAMFP